MTRETAMDQAAAAAAADSDPEDQPDAALPFALDNPLECDALREAPVVFLLKKLYATPRFAPAADAAPGALSPIKPPTLPQPTFETFETFGYEHECSLLREPFKNAAGVSARACVMGTACMGKNPSLTGHHESRGGVVLTEVMSPGELVHFLATGTHPSERRCCLLCTRFNVHAGYMFARKQRGFPSSLVLNSFTNMFGDGEYDAQYALPLVGDAAWHGLAGTTVGLHLNALQLVQDADKNWLVDQSALKHSNMSVTQMSRPLYTFAHNDPRLFLQAHFKHRVRLPDASLLFSDYEVLNSQRPKLPALEYTPYLEWPEHAVKSFIHRLIFYRVNRLNELLQQCGNYYGNQFSLLLTVYIDGHVPMAEMMLRGEKVTNFLLRYTAYEDTLPDFGVQLTNAAMCITTPAFQTKKDVKKGGVNPQVLLTQTLIKLLPEYSSPKQFHGMLVRCLGNSALAKPVWSVLQCAILGNFYGSRERMPYAQRYRLITELTDVNAVDFFKALVDDEHLSFFAFREYLQVIANSIPALKCLVEATAPLSQQTERISDALRVMRQNASTNWLVATETATLEMLKRVYKRAPKRKKIPRGLVDVSGSLVTMTHRSLQRRGLKREHGAAFDVDFFQTAYKRAASWRSLDDFAGVPALVAGEGACADGSALLAQINSSSRAVLHALASSPFKRPTSYFDATCIGDAALQRLCDCAAAVDAALSSLVVQLPPVFLAAQVAAVARRFGCVGPADWAVVSKATQIRCCPCCHEVKNFVLLEEERGESQQRNTRSAGFKKLTLDVDTGRLTCAMTASCGQYDLVTLDVISRDEATGELRGGIAVTRQGAYMVSPCCGFLCTTGSVKANPSGFDCPACCRVKHSVMTNAPDLRVCGYCSKRLQAKVSAENTVLLRDEKNAVQKYSFCKVHARSWSRPRNGYLTFDFVSKNMSNRTGSGLILNPV